MEAKVTVGKNNNSGFCSIKSKTTGIISKSKINNNGNELTCMVKGKRYKLTKNGKTLIGINDNKNVTLVRARKHNSYNTKTNSRRKRRSTRRPRSLFNSRRSLTKRTSKVECKKQLSKKIATNIREFKKGKFVSRSQAIAVSYSQIKKEYPKCKKWLNKK